MMKIPKYFDQPEVKVAMTLMSGAEGGRERPGSLE